MHGPACRAHGAGQRRRRGASPAYAAYCPQSVGATPTPPTLFSAAPNSPRCETTCGTPRLRPRRSTCLPAHLTMSSAHGRWRQCSIPRRVETVRTAEAVPSGCHVDRLASSWGAEIFGGLGLQPRSGRRAHAARPLLQIPRMDSIEATLAIRAWGGRAVRWGILRCEEAEEEERRPPPLALAAAALPRIFGLKIGTR